MIAVKALFTALLLSLVFSGCAEETEASAAQSEQEVPDSVHSDSVISNHESTICTLSVHSDLDSFEISFFAVGPPDAVEGFQTIHKLVISPLGADSSIEFAGLEANHHDIAGFQSYFVEEDMNFDGYTDFRLLESPTAGPNTYWYFWIFDPEAGMFYRSLEYGNANLVSPEFLQEEQLIRCFHRDGMGIYGTDYYICEDDVPILVKAEQTEYSETDSIVTTVSELIDGKMTVTDRIVNAAE